MFHKLRWKLTAFNTAITGAILLCMTFLCLFISEENTRSQTRQNFSDDLHTVSSYLEAQSQISDTWLRQMEGDLDLHISIRDGGKPLFFMGLSAEKGQLAWEFQQARDYAGTAFGLDSGTSRKGGSCSFLLKGKAGEAYYAGVSLLPKKDTMLELILLYPLAQMERGIWHQRLVVCLAALVALGLLGLFSWVFTGKMLRPIQENQRRQTEFIAAASHELRTPLAAILSAASAMERAEPVQRSQFSHMIHREGNRMSRLIGDMLTLASSDSKRWELQREAVELDMLLLEVYETHAPLAKEKGLTLTLSLYGQDIPPIRLDRDRITQVLSILLDNARNMTPAPGAIELELTLHKNRVRIRVSDTGPGVPDSEKTRIFQRFYRGERSRSSRAHFGLGLSIADQIVKQHRGKIWVQDAPAGGAQFVVELPVN